MKSLFPWLLGGGSLCWNYGEQLTAAPTHTHTHSCSTARACHVHAVLGSGGAPGAELKVAASEKVRLLLEGSAPRSEAQEVRRSPYAFYTLLRFLREQKSLNFFGGLVS